MVLPPYRQNMIVSMLYQPSHEACFRLNRVYQKEKTQSYVHAYEKYVPRHNQYPETPPSEISIVQATPSYAQESMYLLYAWRSDL